MDKKQSSYVRIKVPMTVAHFEQEDGAQKSMSVFSKGAITLKMTGSK